MNKQAAQCFILECLKSHFHLIRHLVFRHCRSWLTTMAKCCLWSAHLTGLQAAVLTSSGCSLNHKERAKAKHANGVEIPHQQSVRVDKITHIAVEFCWWEAQQLHSDERIIWNQVWKEYWSDRCAQCLGTVLILVKWSCMEALGGVFC